MPYVICFDEKYKLEDEKFGPWTKYQLLIRISDGKKYKLTRNASVPMIVRNDSLIIPTEYNILPAIDTLTTFKVYKLY